MLSSDAAAAHRSAMEIIHYWTSNKATTVAIVAVIDLYKTDPYRPQKTGREWGNGRNACVVRHVLLREIGGDFAVRNNPERGNLWLT